MAIVFVAIGSFFFGAFLYVFWRGNLKKIYIAFFKQKEIKQCKERLRALDFSRVDKKERIEIYVSKFKEFSPEIIAEAEQLYFKQKLFDDLMEYLLQMNYNIEEIFTTKKLFKRFEYSKKLNKNHSLVRTLIEHNWNPKIIKSAFETIEIKGKIKKNNKQNAVLPIINNETITQLNSPEIKPERVKSDIDAPRGAPLLKQGVVENNIAERGVKKNNGKPRKQPSLPRLKEQIEQDLEETTSSAESGTTGESDARGISRASSNESGTSPRVQGEFAQSGNVQIGTIAPSRESTQRNKKYFN